MSANVDNKVVFAIPLKPRVMSKDWDLVEQNLIATIKSIQGSTSDDYIIAVAGHDAPDLSSVKDDRIQFLESPFEPQLEIVNANIDKNRKRAVVGAWAKSRLTTQCHFVFLDADDLVHRDLVRHVRESHGTTGFVVEHGYRFDRHTRGLETIDQDFCNRCGSCFVPLFTRDQLPNDWSHEKSRFCRYRGHKRYPALAERYGMPLRAFPFRAIVYVINHDESLQVAKKGIRSVAPRNTTSGENVRKILAEDYNYLLPA